MARKRYSDEDALKILREIDVHLLDGLEDLGTHQWNRTAGPCGRPRAHRKADLRARSAPQELTGKRVTGHSEIEVLAAC
jgi:hypothetical protein